MRGMTRIVALMLLAAPLSGQGSTTDLLPKPTGALPVGRTTLFWADSSRTGLDGPRGLVVYVWYPARSGSHAPPAAYIPERDRIRSAIGDSAMAQEFGAALHFIELGGPATHALDNAPVSLAQHRFPVLVFSHGFGESVLTYSVLLEDLASHGYVVFGVEHPADAYAVAFPDGRVVPFPDSAWNAALQQPRGAAQFQLAQVPIRGSDLAFVVQRLRTDTMPVLGRLADHLDVTRVGVFGHSLGGLAAARACALDPRIRACMNLDADFEGFPFLAGDSSRITQPFLFFASDHSLYERPGATAPSDEDLAQAGFTRTRYDSLMHAYRLAQDHALQSRPGGAFRIMLETPGFRHRSFIDLTLLNAEDTSRAAQARTNLALIREYTRAFFDLVIKGEQQTPLNARVSGPGVTIESFQARH